MTRKFVFPILIFLCAFCSQTVSAENSAVRNPASDFDGDGKADIAVFRPSDGFWYVKKSTGGFLYIKWGMAGDIPLPGDYDGDGKSDFMVYRGFGRQTFTDGFWYLLKSLDYSYKSAIFGQNLAILQSRPVPADYDGDGKKDLAFYTESDHLGAGGSYNILKSSTNTITETQWGRNIYEKVQADYDGDGKADLAVRGTSSLMYPEEAGVWYILQSLTGTMRTERFGYESDLAVPADYDGDGKADIAVYRPSTGIWYRINSRDNSFFAMPFGISTDVPVPADYDGDLKTDIGVFRNGTWYLWKSTEGFAAEIFGTSGDIPLYK